MRVRTTAVFWIYVGVLTLAGSLGLADTVSAAPPSAKAAAEGVTQAAAGTRYVTAQPAGAYTFAGLADWDRDGNVDIVARQAGTGDLLLFPGISSRGYSPHQPVKIGNGW